EIEDAAVLARGEIEPGLLLVVHEERGRLLLVEGREALELAAGAHELDAPAHDFRNGKPGFQLVEELGREAHWLMAESAANCRLFPISGIRGASRDNLSPLVTGGPGLAGSPTDRNSHGQSAL